MWLSLAAGVVVVVLNEFQIDHLPGLRLSLQGRRRVRPHPRDLLLLLLLLLGVLGLVNHLLIGRERGLQCGDIIMVAAISVTNDFPYFYMFFI